MTETKCLNVNFSGSDLKNLYLTDPEHEAFNAKENIERLLNYQMFDSDDSIQDTQITDYCVDILKNDLQIDEKTKKEYYDKFMMEVDARELRNKALTAPNHTDLNDLDNLDLLFNYQMTHLNNKTKKDDRKVLLTAVRLSKRELMMPILKRFAATAALIVICLFTTEMIGQATGRSMVSYIIDNIQKNFNIRFNDIEDNTLPIEHTMEALSIVPHGFRLSEEHKMENELQKMVYYTYLNDSGDKIDYIIAVYNNINTSVYSETNGRVKKFKIKGQTYFKFKNQSRNVIQWHRGTAIYTLESKLSEKFLIKTIKKNFGDN